MVLYAIHANTVRSGKMLEIFLAWCQHYLIIDRVWDVREKRNSNGESMVSHLSNQKAQIPISLHREHCGLNTFSGGRLRIQFC